MEVSHLTSFGIPQVVTDCWREKLGEELLPVQVKAVTKCAVLEGKSLLVSSPTSSGKTFCGELAATAAIFRRKKALFLVPLKSIAEEKFEDFRERYRKLGIRMVISTRDRSEFDRDLERGDFDLGILIYEKFNQLLIKNIDLISVVDLILVDEIQMIGDEVRGAVLELALLKVLSSDYAPQIVALSAVLKEPEELAEWLGCQLLEDSYRPVELRQGVLTENGYCYKSFNNSERGTEHFCQFQSDEVIELLLANVEHLVARDEQILVFLKGKRDCERLAAALSERNLWRQAGETIGALSRESGSPLKERLLVSLQSAVAFHHAGLSYRQRRILEEGFRRGEIKALISTTTLAMGVNLPAQTVFIDTYKYHIGPHSGRPMIVPLSWNEFEGMSGRAGRLGKDCSFGRSVLIAGSPLEAETMWNSYINGSPDELRSQLLSRSLGDSILDLTASRAATDVAKLTSLLGRSLHASQGGRINEEEITAILGELERTKLLFRRGNKLEVSPLGSLISLKGMTVGSGMAILSFLDRYHGSDYLSWFYLILSLPDAAQSLPFISWYEQGSCRYRQRLIEYKREQIDICDDLNKLTEDDYLISDNQKARLKSAFLLLDWIGDTTTAELEVKFQISIGSILQLSEAVAWLLDGAAAITALRNRPESVVSGLRCLSGAAGRGFHLPELSVNEFGFKAEQRDLVWALVHAGITSAEQINQSNRATIISILGDEETERLIRKFADRDSGCPDSREKDMPYLRLSGDQQGERVLINFGATEINLTSKSFSYLFKLSAARLSDEDGWLSKEEIEPGFNQAKNIYRVKQELKRFATGLEEYIENNKSGYYRINLLPEQIRIDFGRMKSFHDLELVEISSSLETKLAS